MTTIANNLDIFTSHVRNETPLSFNEKGEWNITRGIKKYLYRISWLKKRELKNITLKFIEALDEQERQKIFFHNSRSHGQVERFRKFLYAGQVLTARYQNSTTPELNTLTQRLEGMRYRIEETFGGQNATPTEDADCQTISFQQLCHEAHRWKQRHLYPNEDKKLSHLDYTQLVQTARHPQYVSLLLRDPGLRNSFFKWALRDRNEVNTFIQYPATCEKLHRNYIQPRLGYFGGLTIQRQPCASGGEKKVLTQPFRTEERTYKNISILDEMKEIRLYGCHQLLKIRDIFTVFRRKNLEIGNIEYFGHYEYFNCGNPPCNIDDPNLIFSMKTIRTYSYEEIKTAYAIPDLQEGQWVKIYRATRSSENLTVEGCHAFLEIAVPTANGYEIKSCGILAAEYPKTLWQKLVFLGKTVFGKLYSPDDNFAMLTRQQCAAPFILVSGDENRELTEQVRKLFREGQEKRLIFQAGGDNCSAKIQKVFLSRREQQPNAEGKVKNLFLVNFIKTTPMQPLGSLFKFFRKCPAPTQKIFIKFLEIIFGGYSALTITNEAGKRQSISLARSDFHHTQKVYTPCLLFDKINKGKIPGTIWYGPDPLHARM